MTPPIPRRSDELDRDLLPPPPAVRTPGAAPPPPPAPPSSAPRGDLGALEAIQARTDAILDPSTTLAIASPRTQALVAGGRASIAVAMGEHRLGVAENRVGRYYGSASAFAAMSPEARQAHVDHVVLDAASRASLAPLQETNCIEWCLQHLRAAYRAAGMDARWSQIEARVRNAAGPAAQRMLGTRLARELQRDGWEPVYFNRDVAATKSLEPSIDPVTHRDTQDAHRDSVKVIVEKKAPYYGLHIRHKVTDYAPVSEKTTENTRGLAALARVPFFYGFARGGAHTFLGYDGVVNELHWSRGPTDPRLIDETPMADFVWHTGVIMVPPKTWRRR